MARLFICEKPSLAEALAQNLGKAVKKDSYYEVGGDYVAALRGHIMELYQPADYDEKYKKWSYDTLPIIPEEFKKSVKSSKGYPAIYKTVKELLKKADSTVNVGDPDREGQLLVDEVLLSLKSKLPCKRLFINAMDDTTIKRALASMEDNASEKNYNTYLAALAREQMDWLIGINATRKFTIDNGGNLLRIGRVKIPILALVARRNEQIDKFTSIKHYTLSAHFRGEKTMPFPSNWQPDKDVLDDEGRLLDVFAARACENKCKGKPGIIKKIEKKKEANYPPLPFSLSSLQKEAGPKFKFNPAKVLELAQSLYEKKLTTYPRSDSNYLPESQYEDAATIIENMKLIGEPSIKEIADNADVSIKGKCYNTGKVEAHHAIIPTMVKVDLATLSQDEQKLYSLISTRFLLQFYPAHTFESTTVTICCEEETFIAKGKHIINNGWKSILKEESSDAAEERKLPELNEGEELTMSSIYVSDKETTPPKRFTQDTLIGAMTSAHKYVQNKELRDKVKSIKGIGTEATRSTIIADLVAGGQLIEEGNKKELYVSDSVKELLAFLPDTLTYPDQTALMELDLDKIAKGTLSIEDYMKTQADYVKELIGVKSKFTSIGNSPEERPSCPACKTGKLYLHDGKYSKFWSCNNYKNGCKATFPDSKGTPSIHTCPICNNGFLKRIKGKDDEYFWSCSERASGCTATFSDNKIAPVIKLCPKCKTGYVKKWHGKNGDYYQCPECKEFYSVTKTGLPVLNKK